MDCEDAERLAVDVCCFDRGLNLCVFLVNIGLADTGKAMVSKDTAIERWVAAFDTLVAQDLAFPMEFVVPKGFGVPGAIVVKNRHPNEFLLVSFSLNVPEQGEAHYQTNSWVYNTVGTEGRIFFLNKVDVSQCRNLTAACNIRLSLLLHSYSSLPNFDCVGLLSGIPARRHT